jgi:hypothetical protein
MPRLQVNPPRRDDACSRLVIANRMIVDRFKSRAIGGCALDQPVSLSVIDLPFAMPSANRLLDIGLREMPLVKSKYRVRCPDESFDGHEADILRP